METKHILVCVIEGGEKYITLEWMRTVLIQRICFAIDCWLQFYVGALIL